MTEFEFLGEQFLYNNIGLCCSWTSNFHLNQSSKEDRAIAATFVQNHAIPIQAWIMDETEQRGSTLGSLTHSMLNVEEMFSCVWAQRKNECQYFLKLSPAWLTAGE